MNESQAANDEFLRQMCHHANVAIIATDADFRIRFWNSAASRMFGGSAETMLGESLISIVPHDRRELAERMLDRCRTGGEVGEFQFQHRDSQGRRVHLAVVMSPVINEQQACVGVSVYVRDVTRRVEAQQHAAANQKMAALGSMAGSVAHHFNNLLCGLITSADFACQSNDPQTLKRALQSVATSLSRASRLTQQLLAFAEGTHVPPAPVDVRGEVARALEARRAGLSGQGITVTDHLEPVEAVLPAQLIATLLETLLANAVEAMPQGGQITIHLAPAADHGGFTLRVSDNGTGIAEELQTRVFEPFFTTKGGLGSGPNDHAGLGLAVAHGIVRDAGGAITFCSSPQTGTTFSVQIPGAPSTPSPA